MIRTVDVVTGEENFREMTPEEAAALPASEPPQVRPITRRQCARALFARGMIAGPEAIAMAARGEPPVLILKIFAGLPEPDRTNAYIDFAADTYERSNPLLASIMDKAGSTPAEIDNFFRAAAAL